jgi:hypothetical protein
VIFNYGTNQKSKTLSPPFNLAGFFFSAAVIFHSQIQSGYKLLVTVKDKMLEKENFTIL